MDPNRYHVINIVQPDGQWFRATYDETLKCYIPHVNAKGLEFADSMSLDAFGRQRISNTGQRFDVEFTYDKQTLIIDEVTVGGATATHNSDGRDVTLAIGGTDANRSALLSGHYHVPYTPGNSQLIDITGTLDYAGIGGGICQVFLRDGITGTLHTVNQDSWGLDNAADVDWSHSQIFSIDFQSLRIGRIRFNLVRDGLAVTVHQIVNDNLRSRGYWQMPGLPPYWRIYNEGDYTVSEIGYGDTANGVGFRYLVPADADASMLAVCATVKSEGGANLFDMPGFPFSAPVGAPQPGKTVSNTLIPLLSIRPALTFNSLVNRSLIIPLRVSVFTSAQPIFFAVYLNPTLTNATFANAITGSAVEYDIAATALTGGTQINGDFVAANNRGGVERIDLRVPLSLNIAGTVGDILTIAAYRATNVDASGTHAEINWKEIR